MSKSLVALIVLGAVMITGLAGLIVAFIWKGL